MNSTSGISDPLPKKGYLLRSNPADANHLAFFYLDITHGEIDVFMRESFDEGINWSSATRINDDPIANNRIQDLLWADFDIDGNLVVSWRDRRNGTDSTYTKSSEIWGAFRSKDSTSFFSNFQISDNAVTYDSVLAFAGNDFMCIKLVNDTLSAVWGDTRDGKLNIWFQRMSVTGMIVSTNQISSENIPNIRIYPNPTVSKITVEGEKLETIIIINQNEKIVSIHKALKGNNKLVIDLNHLSNGVYFVQVTSSKGMVTKKIVKN